MKIYNKIVESIKAPENKNDIWLNKGVFYIYKQGEWVAFTVDLQTAKKLKDMAEKGVLLIPGEGIVIEDNEINLTLKTVNGESIIGEGNIVIESSTPNAVESEEVASTIPTPEFPYATKGELTELSAEVSGLSEGIALRNVGAEDTDETVDEPEIGGGGGGMTTPSGDPMHYMFEAVGATYNATDADIPMVGIYGDSYVHKAKHWHLNELGDITNAEMRQIYLYANLDNGAKGAAKYLAGIAMRTNIATWSSSWNGKIKDQEAFAHASNVIVARMRDKEHYIDTNASFTFTGCTALQKILPTLDATSTTAFNGVFENCKNLREVRIKNVKVAIKFNASPLISKASILYLIQKSAATSAMVITLHADAYARLAEDVDIVAALAEKTNVSLAK